MNKNGIGKDILWLLPSVLWFLVTIKLLLTVQPVDPDSFFSKIPHFDKVAHFGIFGIFTACLMFSFCGGRFFNNQKGKIVRTVLIIVCSWGALTEILQGLMLDAREGDVLDFFADALGGFLGVYCYGILHQIVPIVPIYNIKNKELETDQI
ncbi:VanZ family protein [Flammeovirga yaeyamensis]|uniref:VanZ family protein n=1 Tax=Flammeovirga yaeyamensis TaxID=367791 RepID=A0AAX1N532_9BACT|nr:VanZ family protein [Flammeovirga yaeyamensis]MBB3698366.1 VanZ family protein [Flammeovirga yaeyamensis]NMF34282.1 VanZ family protein [Flammeovirga yaeyamensis]QWG01265.1 VanZ family protein [Flammeovirga yaeyamensis]